MPKQQSKTAANVGFSFLQLVVVVGVIAVLVAVFSLIIKPAEIVQRARDSRRLNDLNNLQLTLRTLIAENATTSLGNSNTVYLSLPDSSASCTSWLEQLPTLPPDWSYRCAAQINLNNLDGSGWLPVNLQTAKTGGIKQLPLDPINKPPYYYSYVTANNAYELTAYLVHQLNRGTSTISGKDGGTNACLYEVGTDIDLSPTTFETGRTGNCSTTVDSTNSSIFWAKTYGGGQADFGFALATTSDGALLVSGSTVSFNPTSAWLLKLTTTSQIIWEKAFTVSTSSQTYRSYALTTGRSSNDLFIGGYINPPPGSFGDIFLLKLDPTSNSLWTTFKTYGGGNDDWSQKIIPTSDGGFIVAGYTGSYGVGETDVWLVKLNSDGTIAWQKAYGGSEEDRAYDIIEVSGGYIVVGSTYSSFGPGRADVLVFKVDATGALVWEQAYGGYNDEVGRAVIKATDGNLIVVGSSNSASPSFFSDLLTMKLNSDNGSIIWQKLYGGLYEEIAYDVIVTPDGNGYAVVGHTFSASPDGGADVWLLQLDLNGNLKWQKAYGGSKNDYGRAILALADGYIIAGSTNSFGAGDYDIWLLKTSLDGVINFNPTSGAQLFEPPTSTSTAGLSNIPPILNITDSTSNVTDFGNLLITPTNATVIQQAP